MIPLHEIRLGNYVQLNNKPVVINAAILSSEKAATDLNAIPLDSSLLTKCNFEEIGTGINPDTRESETVYKNDDIYLSEVNGVVFIKIGIVHFKIPSLHRLQNLYADLTGKEVEVNL